MKKKRKRADSIPATAVLDEAPIQATHAGEWLPLEEVRAMAASIEGVENVTLDVSGVDQLDASVLQLLLVMAAERESRGKKLRLRNVSSALSRWLEFAGANDHFLLGR